MLMIVRSPMVGQLVERTLAGMIVEVLRMAGMQVVVQEPVVW